MAGRLLVSRLRQNTPIQARGMFAMVFPDKIGDRDVVGFGYNGEETYVDRTDFPMPAIRFKRNTSDILALREKERGDWKKLTIEEKKLLYRASFCQTFSEIDAPNGEWKQAIAIALLGSTIGFWLYLFTKVFVKSPLPESFDEEHQRAQLQRMLTLEMNPISGAASYTKSN